MIDAEKRALAEEWARFIATYYANSATIRVAEVVGYFAERGIQNVLDRHNEHRHTAYGPLYRAGYRKIRNGDFVRTDRVTLEQRPQCVTPTRSSAAEVQSPEPPAESTAMVCFEGLSFDLSDQRSPRVRAIELAERAGMKQPRNIKQLIENNRAELENHGELCVRTFEVRTQMPTGGWRVTKVDDYLLNRAQAAATLNRMDVPKAVPFRVQLIQMFDALLDGRLTPAPAPAQESPQFDVVGLVEKLDERYSRRTERLIERMFDRCMLMTKELIAPFLGPRETAQAPAPTQPQSTPAPAADHGNGQVGPVGPDGCIELDIDRKVPPNYFSSRDFLLARGPYSKSKALRLGAICKSLSAQEGTSWIRKPKWYGRELRTENYWHIDILIKAFRSN